MGLSFEEKCTNDRGGKKDLFYITSTTVVLAALHMGWLKFLAVFLFKKKKRVESGKMA